MQLDRQTGQARKGVRDSLGLVEVGIGKVGDGERFTVSVDAVHGVELGAGAVLAVVDDTVVVGVHATAADLQHSELPPVWLGAVSAAVEQDSRIDRDGGGDGRGFLGKQAAQIGR